MAYVDTGSEIADDTVVLRQLKGSPLNIGEYDASMQVIVDALNDLNTRIINIIAGEVEFVFAEYEVTIASGVANCTHGSAKYVLDTEGAASSDILEKITGLTTGCVVILSCADDNRPITVQHGTYLRLASGVNFTLNKTADTMFLRHVGSDVCEEISRSSNE